MSDAQTAVAEHGKRSDRVLGSYDTGRTGPVVVAIAGMHGNEPAGIQAVRAILARLTERQPPLRGRFVGVAGNLHALARGQRFVERDLNRMWTPDRVNRLRASDASGLRFVEEIEQHELLEVFDGLAVNGRRDVVFLDLHSTSADGPPFHCISDTLHSRAIALATPIPLILGVEESIRGSLLEYMEERGWPLILIEAGQHGDPETARNHEAAIWQALVVAGALDAQDVADLPGQVGRLRAAASGLPMIVEIIHRHHIAPGDGFAMRPGFRNFQRVEEGTVLADDASGPITATMSGVLVMPLYQDQGEDGFFIARPVRRSWLSVSTVMRGLRVDRLLPFLPGVRRDPLRATRLLVDPHVARWFSVQLFHLCGFRRLADRGETLVFTRRVE